MSFKFLIFAAFAFSSAAPALAETPATPAQRSEANADTVVEIPFSPPLGRELRYRLSRDVTRNGRPVRTEVTMAVTFRRLGTDYLMSVRLELPAGIPAPDRSSAMARIFSLPTEFRLADDGTFLEIVDLERHWATAEGVLRELSRTEPLAAREQQAMDALVRDMRALPPEAQLELFARNVAPITAAAGTTFRVGEVLRDSGPAHTIAGTVNQSSTLQLDATDGTIARISSRSTVPVEELEARTRDFVSRLAPGRSVGGFRIVSNESMETLEVSLLTGLAERYRAEKVVVLEENGLRSRAVETQTLELVATR